MRYVETWWITHTAKNYLCWRLTSPIAVVDSYGKQNTTKPPHAGTERDIMKTKTRTVLPIGIISEGTLRPEDLIPAYLGAAEDLQLSRTDRGTIRSIQGRLDKLDAMDDPYWESENTQWDLEALEDILGNHAPDYCYFGSHEGDGGLFGVWVPEDLAQCVRDDGGIVVDDLPEVPRGFSGTVLHSNDHGNVSLYRASRGRLRLLWDCV